MTTIMRSLPDLHAARATWTRPVALVPTMGALHAGHISLLAAARRRAATVVASIFVNPTQFNAAEDLARYPRDEAGDLARLREAGCDAVWLPDVETMYPPEASSMIEIGGPALGWEGAARPGHFRGVATVVAKLFGQIRPDLALFGAKDWQQVQVIRRMTADLLLPVDVIDIPTMRDSDGLALSSRNRFLSGVERQTAARLPATLRRCAESITLGSDIETCLRTAREQLEHDCPDRNRSGRESPSQIKPETVKADDSQRRSASERDRPDRNRSGRESPSQIKPETAEADDSQRRSASERDRPDRNRSGRESPSQIKPETAEADDSQRRSALGGSSFAVEYLDLVDAVSMRPVRTPVGARLIVAARLGSVRLLDNLPIPYRHLSQES